MKWCADHGLPHSHLLSWSVEDRSKLMAHLTEPRCTKCGTGEWEWDEDRGAYEAVLHVCRGCEVLDFANEDFERRPGAKFVLVTAAKASALRE